MEYSIQELSRLSGVTTRALRWYDHIGLLKPSRVAESGYRYYGPRGGGPAPGHPVLPGPRGGAGPDPGVSGRPRLRPARPPCEATWPLWRRSGRGWTP